MRALAIALAASLTGCASLAIDPDDGGGTKALKYGSRALLILPTLGYSEAAIRQARWREQRQPRIEELNRCTTNARSAAEEALAINRPDLAQGYLAVHDGCLSELQFLAGEDGPMRRYGETMGRTGAAMQAPNSERRTQTPDFPELCSSTVVGSQIRTVCH